MRYHPIFDALWDDYRFLDLEPDAQRLFLFILSCPQRNRLSTFILRPMDAVSRLDLTKKDVLAKLSTVVDAGLIDYDPKYSLVFIHPPYGFLRITNRNEGKASLEIIDLLPPSYILKHLRRLIFQLKDTEKLTYEPVRKAITIRLTGQGLTEGLTEGLDKGLREGLYLDSDLDLKAFKEGGAGGDVENFEAVDEKGIPLQARAAIDALLGRKKGESHA